MNKFKPVIDSGFSIVPTLEFNDQMDDPRTIKIADLIRRFGGSSSNILLDEKCHHFEADGIDGVIGYKIFNGCAVVLGDPVCSAKDSVALIEAFGRRSKEQGWHTVYAVIGSRMASHFRLQGLGLLEFGVEQVINPVISASQHGYNRDLRKKLKRANHAGLAVLEYQPHPVRDAGLEGQLTNLAQTWLLNRSGPQTYWSGIHLFHARGIRRWFYGVAEGRVVGVLAMLRLEGLGGYLLEHILQLPDAPAGTSESLIAHAAETLGAEGCSYASFGPAPACELREVSGLPKLTQHISRLFYRGCCRVFHLDAKMLYREKFRPSAVQPVYLAFDTPKIQLSTLIALVRTFNFSLRN